MRLILILLLVAGSKAMSMEKYVLQCRNDILELSEKYAISQIGTLEKSNRNDGNVLKYQIGLELDKGAPYCAAGVYWCFLQASIDLGLAENEIPIIKSAVANELFNDASRRGIRSKYIPGRHCLIVWRKKNNWSGHIERIIDVKKAGWVSTVGFNVTNIYGQHGVFRKKRNIFHPLGRLAVRGLIGFKERIN